MVVGVTVLAAKLLMVPEDAADASKSAVWSLSSMANVFFFGDTRIQATSPLRAATCRCCISGRSVSRSGCYLFWPLLLLLFYRPIRVRGFLIGASLVAAGSFLLGDIIFARSPAFAYYMLPTRAGELLLGRSGRKPWGTPAVDREPAPAAHGRFGARCAHDGREPGVAAQNCRVPRRVQFRRRWRRASLSLPALIDAARLASAHFPLLVPVGLISYSAYLWHWPLLTFYRYGYGEPGIVTGFALLAATLLFAWLSYRYVEQPARRTRAAPSSIFVRRQYVVPAGAIGALALGIIYGDRVWPALRKTPYRVELAAVRDQTRPAFDYPYVCQRRANRNQRRQRSAVRRRRSDGERLLDRVVGRLERGALRRCPRRICACGPISISKRRGGLLPAVVCRSVAVRRRRRESDCVASEATIRPVIDRAYIVVHLELVDRVPATVPDVSSYVIPSSGTS